MRLNILYEAYVGTAPACDIFIQHQKLCWWFLVNNCIDRRPLVSPFRVNIDGDWHRSVGCVCMGCHSASMTY